eukprot:1013671-Pelagomonas_calceolata.AAC.2
MQPAKRSELFTKQEDFQGNLYTCCQQGVRNFILKFMKGAEFAGGRSHPHRTQMQVVSLDFDGVVCDSVGESSLSAIKVSYRG